MYKLSFELSILLEISQAIKYSNSVFTLVYNTNTIVDTDLKTLNKKLQNFRLLAATFVKKNYM